MAEEHTPPQLSVEGAELLADVVARHTRTEFSRELQTDTTDRHATSSALAHQQRRDRDPLRVPSVNGRRPAGSGVDVRTRPARDRFDISTLPVVPEPSLRRGRSSVLPWVLAGMGLGGLIVAVSLWVAPGASDPTTEVAGAVEQSFEPSIPLATTTPPAVAVGDISLTVYDIDSTGDNVVSFALRLQSLATPVDVLTSDFEVTVLDATGAELLTVTRFEGKVLPVGQSALASVRSEGIAVRPLVIIISVDGREVSRGPFLTES